MTRLAKIPITRPSITALETSYVNSATMDLGTERCYDYISRFELEFARHLGVKYAIATSSGTGAMHLGMAGLGIGPGDEVIVADSTWIASISSAVHLGARPVFVDILRDTWCLDPGQVEAAITPNTKAIVAVHLYGNLCDMDVLNEIGNRHGVPVIEDAAEAVGSIWRGKRAGSMGKFGMFSFHGSKTLSTGEGGMFVTNDDTLHDAVLTLSNHGRARNQNKQFWPEMMGFKYKMSNMQAALGCAQLKRVDELVARKRAILDQYRQRLAAWPGLSLNPEPVGTVIGAWIPNLVFDVWLGVTSEKMVRAFVDEGVDGRVFFHPLSSLPLFGAQCGAPNAADIAQRAVNLPSFHDMTDSQVQRVVEVIARTMRRAGHG